MSVYDILCSFFFYGFAGWCAEVAFAAVRQGKFVNRGFLNGPICPIYGVGVTLIVTALDFCKGSLILLYLASTVLVTFLEWVTGFCLEKIFHHRWWDYSNMPLNIGGYVCPLFSAVWGIACVIVVRFLHPLIRLGISWIPVWIGSLFLTVFVLALGIDLYVTVTGIFRLNRRLERMEAVAEELKKISDQIGENIYQNMMEGREKQEKLKELKEKYRALHQKPSRMNRRLLKAFPKLKSRRYEKALEELRKYLEGRLP